MKKFVVVSLLLLSALQPLSAGAADNSMPAKLWMEQLELMHPDSYSVNLYKKLYGTGDYANTMNITYDCVLHRNETAQLLIRRAETCKETYDTSTNGQHEGLSVERENIFIGNTVYQKQSNHNTDFGAVQMPHADAWLRYDLASHIADNNILSYASRPEKMTRFFDTIMRADQPFSGWTEMSDGTWTMSDSYSAWTPVAMLSDIHKEVIPFPEELQYPFNRAYLTNGPRYTGTFRQTSSTSGEFLLKGSSDDYTNLEISVQYTPQSMTYYLKAVPVVNDSDTSFFEERTTLEGLNQRTELTSTNDDGTNATLVYTVTASNKRALEDPVFPPAESDLAGLWTYPHNYDCSYLQFKDICDHWSLPWLMRAAQLNYIGTMKYGSNPDYLLMPDAAIQRSEFALLINDSWSLDAISQYSKPPYWENDTLYTPSDADKGAWYMPHIQKLLWMDIAVMQDGNRFRPNDTLNRAEVMTFLARIAGKSTGNDSAVQNYYANWRALNPYATTVYFPDVSVDSWYAPYVAFMADKGLLDRTQPRFRPGDAITRAEAITLLERLREAMPHILVGVY